MDLSSSITAPIQAADRLRRRFVIVQSESRADFVNEIDLSTYATMAFSRLTGSGQVLELHGPTPRVVGGFAAEQRETLLAFERVLVRYRHTVVAGDRALHLVLMWSTPSAYEAELFDRVVEGFRERPGPKPVVRDIPIVDAPSDYPVH